MTEFSAVTQKTTLDGTELLLGATTATQITPDKYSGKDIFTRGQLDGMRCFNFGDYITGTPSGTTNYSAELQQCHDDALAHGKAYVFVPAGAYGLLTTVNLKVSMTGPIGGNLRGSFARFQPLMDDGSAALKATKLEGTFLGNLAVAISEDHSSDTDWMDAVGIDWGYYETGFPLPIEEYAMYRCMLENVYVQGVTTGIKYTGWHNTIRNTLTWNCTLAWKTYWTSNTLFDCIITERCRKSIEMVKGNANFFTLFSEEVGGEQAATFDDMIGLTFGTYRTEGHSERTEPWIIVGWTTKCYGFRILGGYMYTPAGNVEAIRLRYVEGYELGCVFAPGENSRYCVSKTVDTTGEIGWNIIHGTSYPTTKAPAQQENPIVNRFPNPHMRGLRFPWAWASSGANPSPETAGKFWHGRSGLRISRAATGTSGNHFTLEMPTGDLSTELSGKELTFSAWIYLGDYASFDVGGGVLPKISVIPVVSSVDQAEVKSAAEGGLRDGWALFSVETKMPSGLTGIKLRFYLNDSTTTIEDTEYMTIGDVTLCTGYRSADIYMGKKLDNSVNGTQYLSSNVIEFYDTQGQVTLIKAFSAYRWVVGDRLTYTDPVSGGSMGEVCTTAGTGAAAVWKAYGAIA